MLWAAFNIFNMNSLKKKKTENTKDYKTPTKHQFKHIFTVKATSLTFGKYLKKKKGISINLQLQWKYKHHKQKEASSRD